MPASENQAAGVNASGAASGAAAGAATSSMASGSRMSSMSHPSQHVHFSESASSPIKSLVPPLGARNSGSSHNQSTTNNHVSAIGGTGCNSKLIQNPMQKAFANTANSNAEGRSHAICRNERGMETNPQGVNIGSPTSRAINAKHILSSSSSSPGLINTGSTGGASGNSSGSNGKSTSSSEKAKMATTWSNTDTITYPTLLKSDEKLKPDGSVYVTKQIVEHMRDAQYFSMKGKWSDPRKMTTVPSPNKYNCYKLVDNTSKYPSLLTCGKFLSRTKLLEGNNLDLPIRDVREAVNPLSKFKRMSRPCSFIKDKRFKKNSQATSDTQLDLAPGMYEVHKSTLNLKASVSFGTSKRCDISRLPGSAGCWKGPGPGKYEVRDRDRCGNSTLDLRGCKM